jgi:cytochrome c-type biogenesis protein CcmE
MNNRKLILGGVVIAAFLGFGMFSFQKSLTPYVSFAEARDAGRAVQVKGYPNHATSRLDPELKAFCFTLRDDTGSTMDVVYRGAKPGNFEQAESVVAIGRYEAGTLHADQLLVKCPSKYEAEYPGATEHPEGIPIRGGGVSFDAPPDSGVSP